MLGPTATTVKAVATAAIVSVISPTPIIVTHPSMDQALYLNGNTDTIKICGGPSRSIQVNSTSSTALRMGQGHIDLSQAGTADPGDCSSTSAGADIGITGGPSTDPGVDLGTAGTGHYVPGDSPILDPLANVAAPPRPPNAGSTASIANGTHGCAYAGGCTEYSPGYFPSLTVADHFIFKPGVYFVEGGDVKFKLISGGGASPAYSGMCSGCTADPDTGNGILIYATVPNGTPAYTGVASSRPAGRILIENGVNFTIQGPDKTTTINGNIVPAGPYYNILLWEDRTSNAHTGSSNNHSLGQGSGCFSLVGAIYITNTLGIMTLDPSRYQEVQYNGTPCSTTVQQGYIIVSNLQIIGTTTLKMKLTPYGYLNVRKVALVE